MNSRQVLDQNPGSAKADVHTAIFDGVPSDASAAAYTNGSDAQKTGFANAWPFFPTAAIRVGCGESRMRAQFDGCCIINEGPVHSKFRVNMMQHDIESFLG